MDTRIETILQGESETVEYKKTTALLREAITTLCAFANHHGGYVLRFRAERVFWSPLKKVR